MKKFKLLILSLLLILTLIPVSIYAEGEDNAPDVSVYASRTQLMDDTFMPSNNGTANNIGKIIFGKNSSGDPQEWYI